MNASCFAELLHEQIQHEGPDSVDSTQACPPHATFQSRSTAGRVCFDTAKPLPSYRCSCCCVVGSGGAHARHAADIDLLGGPKPFPSEWSLGTAGVAATIGLDRRACLALEASTTRVRAGKVLADALHPGVLKHFGSSMIELGLVPPDTPIVAFGGSCGIGTSLAREAGFGDVFIYDKEASTRRLDARRAPSTGSTSTPSTRRSPVPSSARWRGG